MLFTENNQDYKILNNNLKGKIIDFQDESEEIYFKVKIDKVINKDDLKGVEGIILIEKSQTNSTIGFKIKKNTDTDADDSKSNIPFQIAYAISIHKSQGLEYNNVRVIITNESEEQITHSIFYTAITRAKKDLKIYWSAETQKKVIESFRKMDKNYEIKLIKDELG